MRLHVLTRSTLCMFSIIRYVTCDVLLAPRCMHLTRPRCVRDTVVRASEASWLDVMLLCPFAVLLVRSVIACAALHGLSAPLVIRTRLGCGHAVVHVCVRVCACVCALVSCLHNRRACCGARFWCYVAVWAAYCSLVRFAAMDACFCAHAPVTLFKGCSALFASKSRSPSISMVRLAFALCALGGGSFWAKAKSQLVI